MKKITMIVPDSLVNSLLSLVADQSEYLQVEAHSVEEPKAVKDALPIRKHYTRPIRRQSSIKVVADLLLSGWNETSELKYLTHWMPLLPLPGTAARKQGGA